MLGRMLWVVCAVAALPWAYADEKLTPEGFPADWQASDFEIEDVAPLPARTSGTGVVSIPISQLPRVAADPSLTPAITSASVQVTLTNPMPQLPVVAVDDVGKVPDDVAKLDSWGPLTELAGGVSEKAWKNVSSSEVVVQLARLQAKPLESRTLQSVMNRLMLTRAKPAADASPTAGALLAARAGTLDKMGQDEQAYALWRVVPPLARNTESALARGWAFASVVAGQTAEPCALARKLVVGAEGGPWQELAVVCTALDRASGGLDMGLNVASEQAGFDDVLRQLLVAVRDDEVPAKLAADAKISPLSDAVMAVYPALLEAPTMPKLPSIVLRRLLQTQALPLGLRIEAAELLLHHTPNPVAAESLRVLYEAEPIPPDQLVNALNAAKTLNGISARTLLWQALRTAPSNDDKVAAWNALAASATASGRGNIPLWLSPARAGIAPMIKPDGTGLATAVHGAWLVNDIKNSTAWRTAAETVPSATVVLIGARAQLAMEAAVQEGTLAAPVLDQWLVARSMGDAGDRLASVRTLAVLDGVGVKLPEGAWSKLESMMAVQPDVTSGNAVQIEALKSLASQGTLGPVVVKLAEWVQAKPLAAWAPMEAKAAVESLQAVGLKREAKDLALELVQARDAPSLQSPKLSKTSKVSGTTPTPKLTIQNMKASERK